ncbi:hypothetical protein [Chroococcidiopsis sp.]|uniref:hypothetical protein n=1 Tax=Chroococcidiopsis sp. TaxID=3088168 RepID=UPI003F2D9EEB
MTPNFSIDLYSREWGVGSRAQAADRQGRQGRGRRQGSRGSRGAKEIKLLLTPDF